MKRRENRGIIVYVFEWKNKKRKLKKKKKIRVILKIYICFYYNIIFI